MKKLLLLLFPNIALASNSDNMIISFLVFAFIAWLVILIIRTLIKQSSNQDSFYNKKRIDEHIKLILQTSYAAAFFLEDAKVNGDYKDQIEEGELAEDILKIYNVFIKRDLTKNELDFILKINMDYRRVYDAAGLKSSTGNFDDIMSPLIAETKTWEEIIADFKHQMTWLNK